VAKPDDQPRYGLCVWGKLTALHHPERELVSVPARQTYYEPARPFLAVEPPPVTELTAQQRHDDLLDIEDVLGKRIVSTRLHRTVTIREENATAALEVMSRFAANPKWLIYLPPTMSPSETTQKDGYLEYPTEAFSYYRHEGAGSVICEQKHMGSRAVVILCRDEGAAKKHFGVIDEESASATRGPAAVSSTIPNSNLHSSDGCRPEQTITHARNRFIQVEILQNRKAREPPQTANTAIPSCDTPRRQ